MLTYAKVLVMVAVALSQWGNPAHKDIHVKLEPSWVSAQVGCTEDYCNLIVDPERMLGYDEAQQQDTITHEVGHVLGLDHYGSCNWNVSIMGCPYVGVQGYDRVKLLIAQGHAYRLGGVSVAKD